MPPPAARPTPTPPPRSGIPTLDGLGPVGGDDHSVDEWLDLDSVVPRTTLLASLIARVGEAL